MSGDAFDRGHKIIHRVNDATFLIELISQAGNSQSQRVEKNALVQNQIV